MGPGQSLPADAAHDSNRLRDRLAAVGASAVIEPTPRRPKPPDVDRDICKGRDRIERFFSKLRHHRAIATPSEKHRDNVPALVELVSTRS